MRRQNINTVIAESTPEQIYRYALELNEAGTDPVVTRSHGCVAVLEDNSGRDLPRSEASQQLLAAL